MAQSARYLKFITINDTINLRVTYFAKNTVYCCTEGGIPYALIIGNTNNENSIPKTLSVFAKCNNESYKIGQNLRIVSIEDPTIGTDLGPLFVTRDTTINNMLYHWIIGAEHPIMWGKVL